MPHELMKRFLIPLDFSQRARDLAKDLKTHEDPSKYRAGEHIVPDVAGVRRLVAGPPAAQE